jgi:hypothetical protein
MSLPSSKFVPAINGSFEKVPLLKSLDGKSGIIPPGPSITGVKGNPGPRASTAAANISSAVADRRQLNVLLLVALRHDDTFETKVFHKSSPDDDRAGLLDPAVPD